MASATGRAGASVVHHDLVEIRLLGPLQVRRRDGRLVDAREWRTGKTTDLLRLLALADGRPVPVDQLIAELWPEADEAHGRASLRTAASQLRAVLGAETLERQPAGLSLQGVWVDVAVYERLAGEAKRLLRVGDLVEGVHTAREAEALRLGDLTVHDAGSQWAVEARHAQHAERVRMLLSATEAALSLDWLGDAAELATAALEQDPANEAATRALMQALARRGDRAGALQAYERCRRVLRADLGVEPAAQTRDLHVELQTGVAGRLRPAAAPRREAPALLALVDRVARTGEPATVQVVGSDPVERRRFVADVCAAAGVPLAGAEQPATGDGAPVRVVVCDGPPPAAWRDGLPPRVLLVRLDADPAPVDAQVVLQPLLREELQLLAQQVLGDQPDPALLDELAGRSGGRHGRAFDLLRSWLLDGRVRSSPRGMSLVDEAEAVERRAVRTTLARLVGRLSTLDLEVLGTLAVLDRPVRVEHLVPLLEPEHVGTSPTEARAAVERAAARLTDLAVLTRENGGVVLRSAMLADAVRGWLRPSVLRRVHRAVAERARISSADRVVHWCVLGEPELACAAALEAAEAAVDEGRHEDARTHLLQVCYLAGPEIDLTPDASDLVEELARVLGELDRPADAERVRSRRDRPAGTRLRSLPSALLGESADVATLLAGTPDRRGLAVVPPVVGPATERRGRRQAGHLPDDALPRSARPGQPLHAVARHLVEVLLGDDEHAEHGLQLARRDGALPVGSPGAAALDLLLALVDHDLGRTASATSAHDLALLARQAGPDWSWVPVRILAERHDLDAARRALPPAGDGAACELAQQLLLLARAALATAEGSAAAAAEELAALVGRGIDSGCTVLLPEAAARLALAEAGERFARAQEHFDLFEWSLGEHEPRPRASCLRLLARAALRQQLGEPQRAAAAAAQAVQVAQGSRLLPLAAAAQLERARVLAAAGSSEAVTAMGQARAACRAAGVAVPGQRAEAPALLSPA